MKNRKVDEYTHLALSVMYALYEKGWGKSYPHEIAEIMQRILDLDRKAYKAEIEPKCPSRGIDCEDCPACCDRNICIKNEYNGIGCDECVVTKESED